jgi:CO dehydrogenase/acetyl-CoA synthase beta subunit
MFRVGCVAYSGGTGGDADGRSRRSPLFAQSNGGRTHVLWLPNILAEGIKVLLVRRLA